MINEFREELDEHFVTRREFNKLKEAIMATQADVDAITTQVNQIALDLQTARSQLQTEIDNLAQNNPSVDVTALQNAVAPLDSAVVSLGQLTPDQPPPPAPAPGP